MANLIITIISIGLVAVAAIMGLYYGGQAYQNAQINAFANAIMNESQQILNAERLWASNNNQPDISGMTGGTGLGTVTAYIGNSGINNLIIGGELSNWPSLGGSLAKALPNNSGNPLTSGYDASCYNIGSYTGLMYRVIFAYNSGNYVYYNFWGGPSNNTSCATVIASGVSGLTGDVNSATMPISQIAQAINNTLKQIPANAQPASGFVNGLPQPPAGSSTVGGGTAFRVNFDPSGNLQTNYCYGTTDTRLIQCIFGPS